LQKALVYSNLDFSNNSNVHRRQTLFPRSDPVQAPSTCTLALSKLSSETHCLVVSLGGFNVKTSVNNATWKGNNFSGSGSYMGNKFTATGTFTAPSTVSGQFRAALLLPS